MKGCFQMCYKRPKILDGRRIPDKYHDARIFIPKQDIVKVTRIEAFRDFITFEVFEDCPQYFERSEYEFRRILPEEACYPMYYIKTRRKGRKYLVHPNEREHMERYLAGTDDALYDFVHHLKYLPAAQVSEAARAAEDFEKRRRKMTE